MPFPYVRLTVVEMEETAVPIGVNLSNINNPNAQCPMPNSQCPMPNAQCPMPNPQFPILPGRILFPTLGGISPQAF